LRFGKRFSLLQRFLFEYPKRGEIVFYLLKRRECRLAVLSNCSVVVGQRCLRSCPPPAGVEELISVF
jgi:hypothetical protein